MAVAALMGLGLAACGPASATPPGPRSVSKSSGPPSASRKEAALIVAKIVVPPRALRVRVLNQPLFAKPAVEPGCTPLVDETRYWKVLGSLSGVTREFKAHPEAALPARGGGSLSRTGQVSMLITETSNNANEMLAVTLGGVGRGTVGVRADALVVPPGSKCTSSGAASSGPAN
jgi:hypothetical protein